MNRIIRPFLLVLLLLAGSHAALAEAGLRIPFAGDWRLVALADAEGRLQPVSRAVTQASRIAIDRMGAIGGTVGCNSFNGRITPEGDGFSFSSFMMTRMACMNESGRAEERLMRWFAQTRRASSGGGRLYLYDGEGRALVAFEARPTPR